MVHDSRVDIDAYHLKFSYNQNPRLEAPRFLAAAARGPVPQDDDVLFSPEEGPIRERFQAQLREVGLGRFVGGLVPLNNRNFVALAIHRYRDSVSSFSANQLDRLAGVLPHFAQAFSLAQSASENRSAIALVHGHLDLWPSALAVCTAQGEIRWLNRRAQVDLRAHNVLHIRDFRLVASTSEGQQQLAQALERSAHTDTPTFLTFNATKGGMQLAIQALPASEEGCKLILVSISRPDVSGQIPASAIKTLFGLTEAEARLTSALVAGITVEQYAQQKGGAVGTVRYQLNQVLFKTGAHRQADLVRRVLCSAAGYLALSTGDEVPTRPNVA